MASRSSKRYKVQVASPDQVREFAEGLSENFLQCRELGHIWKPHTASIGEKGRYYERVLKCGRCRCQRAETLSLRGEVLSRSMHYPDNYLAKDMGRVVGAGRDQLRLESLGRFMSKNESHVLRRVG